MTCITSPDKLIDYPDLRNAPTLLDCRAAVQACDWRDLAEPQRYLAIGVDDAGQRAEMMAAGIGDAVPTHTAVVEIGARASRMIAAIDAMPRYRAAGPVTLDLFHRDGKIKDRWLGLHPREFELIWRLAATPFKRVSREEFLTQVWRMEHVPETNSLEVHVSRLRAKLAISQVAWLIETDPDGGYRLGHKEGDPAFPFSSPSDEALDTRSAISNDDNIEEIIGNSDNAKS